MIIKLQISIRTIIGDCSIREYYSHYRKRRKFRGVINFVVFADATILRNLILGQQFTQVAGTRIDYNAERSANSRQSRILP